MSVLAHLADSTGEPGATQALVFILNQQPGIVQAFVSLLGAADIRFNPRLWIESERGDDGGRIPGRPDMKIFDRGENLRVLVENKFWAKLTDAQPANYLNILPDDVSSGLLFIVPGDRVTQIWNVLKTRCEARLLGQESPEEERVRWVRVGDNTMLITDWQNVLHSLEQAADGDDIRCDLFQFRRLVEKLEGSEVFLVLRAEEVENVEVAQRMINYVDVLDSICKRLPDIGMDITCGQSGASLSKYKSIYRNVRRGGEVVGWLAISFFVWHKKGTTPLWLWMNSDYHLPNRYDELPTLFEDVYVSESGYSKFIPIHLTLDVEKEIVVKNAVEQIHEIVRRLT